jgi:hypothetical protein
MNGDRRIQLSQSVAQVDLTRVPDLFLGIRSSGRGAALATLVAQVRAGLYIARLSRCHGWRSLRSVLCSGASEGESQDPGADEHGAEHDLLSLLVRSQLHYTRNLWQGCFTGYNSRFPKGLTRQVFRCMRNGFNS